MPPKPIGYLLTLDTDEMVLVLLNAGINFHSNDDEALKLAIENKNSLIVELIRSYEKWQV